MGDKSETKSVNSVFVLGYQPILAVRLLPAANTSGLLS